MSKHKFNLTLRALAQNGLLHLRDSHSLRARVNLNNFRHHYKHLHHLQKQMAVGQHLDSLKDAEFKEQMREILTVLHAKTEQTQIHISLPELTAGIHMSQENLTDLCLTWLELQAPKASRN